MTVPGMSVQDKKSIVAKWVGLPCQQNPVACVTIIMKTQDSNILAHASNYTKNSPRILAMLVCFLACPKVQATNSSWLSSVLACWCWCSCKHLPSFCCDASITVKILRSVDLDIQRGKSICISFWWYLNWVPCSGEWITGARFGDGQLCTPTRFPGISVSEHALSPGWPAMLANEGSISEWVHRDEEV